MKENRTERVVEMIVELADTGRAELRKQLEGMDIGTERVPDRVFQIWYEMKVGLIPPGEGVVASPAMPFNHPEIPPKPWVWRDPATGMEQVVVCSVVISPWELHLGMVDGGKEIQERYERILRKQYEEVA